MYKRLYDNIRHQELLKVPACLSPTGKATQMKVIDFLRHNSKIASEQTDEEIKDFFKWIERQ